MHESTDKSENPVNRRGFLSGAAAGVTALAVKPPVALAQQAALKPEAHAGIEVSGNQKPGSDFMVDVIKSLGIEYCAANPGIQLPRPARIVDQLRRQHKTPNCSPACTRNPRSPWRTATPRSKASR